MRILSQENYDKCPLCDYETTHEPVEWPKWAHLGCAILKSRIDAKIKEKTIDN